MINILEVLDSENSRINFIKGLSNLSKAQEIREGSNSISNEELELLRNSMIVLNLDEKVRHDLEALIYSNENKIEIHFDSKKQALFFLREGLQICYVEGQYHEAEKEMMREMALKLDVSEGKLEQLEKWVLEGLEWSERGDKILEMEG